ALTSGRGVDAAILTASAPSNDPICLAGELCRDRGRVVVLGQMRVEAPRELFYQKELSVVLSRSYGPGRYDPVYEERGVDYPAGYVRWTEGRNMQEFVAQVARGHLHVEPLVSHRFSIDAAPE